MANPHRGEVAFQAEGTEWVLRYGTNALVELEAKVDLPTGRILAQLQDSESFRISYMRAIFWAGLRKHHHDMTEERAGDLMDDIGHPRTIALIGDAFSRAFPTAEDTDATRPPKGLSGTGKNS